ncbi:hypothetical protein [Tychonema sp. LEGE 07203]|uniref:hypothetical protein n=1 Tax=Tychonema sp. LEGE 07203 TaxID=1828671 RepID=UPI00187FDD1B|nr:hypothetical protein [Tychonema sp. LEGE 07203]MBE9092946.1 hypothetical protein [Tychonema sp. LEGE 07203]
MVAGEDSQIQVAREVREVRSRDRETIFRLNHLCLLEAETIPACDRANCTIRQLAIAQHS